MSTPYLEHPEESRIANGLQALSKGVGSAWIALGEGGHGKTTLLENLVVRARAKHVKVVRVTCQPRFGPVVEDSDDDVSPSVIHVRETGVALPGDEALQTAAEILYRLGYGTDGEAAAGLVFDHTRIAKTALSAVGRFVRDTVLPVYGIGESIVEGIKELSAGPEGIDGDIRRLAGMLYVRLEVVLREHPALIVVDDAHFIDPQSCDLLFRLVARTPECPCMFMFGARPGEAEQFALYGHPLMGLTSQGVQKGYLRKVECGAWSRDGIREYTAEAYPGLQEDDALVQHLWQATSGFPMFVTELLKLLEEQGRLAPRGGEWRVTPGAESIVLPEKIEEVILEKLHRAGEAIRATIERASVEGERFHLDVVSVLTRPSERAELRSRLKAADEYHGLVRMLVDGHVDELGGLFTFSHELYHNFVYSRIPPEMQRALHGLVAEELVRVSGDNRGKFARQIVQHCSRAGQVERLIEYSLPAAEQAAAGFDWPTAQTYAEEALSKGKGRATPQAVLALKRVHCEALYRQKHWDQAVAGLEDILSLAVPLRAKEAAADALCLLSHIAVVRENIAVAQTLAQRALKVSGEIPDPHRQIAAIVRWHRSMQAVWPPEKRVDTYRSHLRPALLEILGQAQTAGDKRVEAKALRWLARVARALLEDVDAMQYLTGGLEAARRVGDLRLVVELYYLKIDLISETGNAEELRRAYLESIKVARSINDPMLVSDVLSNYGGRLKEMKRFDEAQDCLKEALKCGEDAGAVELMCVAHGTLASLYEAWERLGDALSEHTAHLELARMVGNAGGMVDAGIGIARVRLKSGEPEVCLSQLDEVLWPVEGRKREQVEAALLRARAQHMVGNPEEAREALGSALERAAEAHDGYWIAQALMARAELATEGLGLPHLQEDIRRAIVELRALCEKWPTSLPLKTEHDRAVALHRELLRRGIVEG